MRLSHLLLAVVVAALMVSACKEAGTIKLHSLKFVGVKSVDVGRLKAALATHEGSKLPWGKKAYFDRERFDADLARIQAFYNDRGFPDARVTGFDVNLNDKQDAVDVVLRIAEGDPVLLVKVDFAGFDVIPPAHLDQLRSQIPMKIGQPRDRQLVLTAHELAVNEVKDHGYPYAKVITSENDGPTGKQAIVTFAAEPGQLAHFGPIQIQGNSSVSDRVVERELTFKPGDLYRRSVEQQSQRRLYGLALFQFATIEPLNLEQQLADVPMRVTVAEGKHQRVNFGVGYGTEEKARVDAEYRQVNFLGGARTAGATARYSSLDRGLRLDFNQPYFFAPRFSLSAEAQDWYTYTPAYNATTLGAKAILKHQLGLHTSWSVSIATERDTSTVAPNVLADPTLRPFLIGLGLNPITGDQSGTVNALGFDFQHSTADSVLNAHHGYQLSFHTEQAGQIVPGTFRYYALSADLRHYLPIHGNNFVLASRLQFGDIRPNGRDDRNVPFSKKYFLGGSTTVRGWGLYEISPLASGLPIGGDSMLLFTEEARALIRGNLSGVLFLDAGNVWAAAFSQKLNDLRYAVGPGLRYQTPIGPIRVDFGYQLNPIPGLLVNGQPQTRRWRVHFSIGQAF
jgi:outer membrane protein insertion porin family/translocation and assembly module TamA